MISIPKKQKIYHAHRENQNERILEAAEELFIRDGIDNVSMGAIAKTARLARKTLYEYYTNKQEIAFAILQIIADERTSNFERPPQPEGTGFQRVEGYLLHMVHLLESHPEHFRFLVEFNMLYAREGGAERLRQVFVGRSDYPLQMIKLGIRDGSIRPDADADLLCASLLNLVAGMNTRFALLGSQVAEEYGFPALDMYHEICRNFLRGIQTNPVSPVNKKHK
jgi:AcrR family transcriptional regulator